MVSLLPVKEEIFAKCFTNKYLELGTGIRCLPGEEKNTTRAPASWSLGSWVIEETTVHPAPVLCNSGL